MGFAARYGLETQIATFDFFTWLCHVKKLGATEIVLSAKTVTKKFSEAEMRARYENLIKPGPALAGLAWREGDDGVECGSRHIQELVKLGPFERLCSVLPPGKARYTVTIRDTGHNSFRNSDEEVWRTFAAEIGATVIEDYRVKPIHLHERMALYAGAEMNFGVTNGPVFMLFFTPYPVMLFDCLQAKKSCEGHGIKLGQNVPFALKDQMLVWDERPTLADIRARFAQWKDARG